MVAQSHPNSGASQLALQNSTSSLVVALVDPQYSSTLPREANLQLPQVLMWEMPSTGTRALTSVSLTLVSNSSKFIPFQIFFSEHAQNSALFDLVRVKISKIKLNK